MKPLSCGATLVLLHVGHRRHAVNGSTYSDTTPHYDRGEHGQDERRPVRISAGGFVGSGTILKIQNTPDGGQDFLVLTADHVVRNAAGGGTQLYSPNQISIAFGNLVRGMTYASAA